MASNTTRLNLYKINPSIDGEMTFNIQTILNDNWDKIDANVAKITDIPTIPSSLPANGGNSTTVNNHTAATTPNTTEKNDLIGMVNEVNNNLASHEAGKASSSQLGHVKQGSRISIDDNGIISVNTNDIPIKTTTDKTYYVNTSSGNDSNDGLSSGASLKTIQAAINKLPQIVNQNVTINIAAGTYAETVNIVGFIGGGSITLTGTSGVNVNNIVSNNIGVSVIINSVTCVSIITAGFFFSNTRYSRLNSCSCTAATTSYAGLEAHNASIYVFSSAFSNRGSGILANELSNIVSDSCSGTGNTVGLTASFGGVISKNGTQPGGTTAESINGGGVIR